MADDFYEPNASNIMGVGQAIQQGNQLSQSFGNSMDQGAQMQQQIVKTQAMKQQLQQQMQANQLAMQDHVTGQLKDLASMDPSSPIYKFQLPQLAQKMNSLGMPVTEDSLGALLGDDDQRAKIRTAAANMSSLDPQTRLQAQQDWGKTFGTDDMMKAGDTGSDIAAKYLQSTNSFQRRLDTEKQQISQSYQAAISKNSDKLNTLKNLGGLVNFDANSPTGLAQVGAIDAFVHTVTGSARAQQTQYDKISNSEGGVLGIVNKLKAAIGTSDPDDPNNQVDLGKYLDKTQMGDMKKIAALMENNQMSTMYEQLSPIKSRADAFTQKAALANYSFDPSEIFDPKVADAVDRYRNNYAASVSNQAAGTKAKAKVQNQSFDNVAGALYGPEFSGPLKAAIQKGQDINTINQNLTVRGKKAMSQAQYDRLKKLAGSAQ